MRVVEVAAGLVYREGRYLIARRNPGVHLAGFWEFPGGKCEPGETLEECLRRELFEELGIRIDVPWSCISSGAGSKPGMPRQSTARKFDGFGHTSWATLSFLQRIARSSRHYSNRA
jgi:8-oxo-dGTP pyrophosphatase MutT (NUDIX family)